MHKVIINNKICDNSPACGGIEVCPVGALFWDKERGRIGYAGEKCIACGACVNMCPVRAIMLAKSAAEAEKIQSEIDTDPRKPADLFVDRYGADITETQPIGIKEALAAAKSSKGIAVLELYDEPDFHCLVTSISISEIFSGYDIRYMRAQTDEAVAKSLGISEIPALVIFRDGKIIGKVEGYYFDDAPSEKSFLISQVKKILG